MNLKEIGILKTVYDKDNTPPRQGRFSEDIGEIAIYPEYKDALEGLKENDRIIVLYWADKSDRSKTQTVPPMRDELAGVFSTRSPHRPNPILFCICKIVEIKDNKLKVTGLDAYNNSPLVDIKIYSYKVDVYQEGE